MKEVSRIAHDAGAVVLVDAAQSIRHEIVNVRDINCDFLAFSGHKVLGPSGIGVLYGKRRLLESLEPESFGGEMVDVVDIAETTFEEPPLRYEAGTPNFGGAIVLAAALDYVETKGRLAIAQREHQLDRLYRGLLADVDGLRILGTASDTCGCVSFAVDGAHHFDVAALLDAQGFAIRSGNLCARPLLREHFGLDSVCRLSPAFYITGDEIRSCVRAVEQVSRLLMKA